MSDQTPGTPDPTSGGAPPPPPAGIPGPPPGPDDPFDIPEPPPGAPAPPASATPPPPRVTDGSDVGEGGNGGWPGSAKVTAAVLAFVALIAGALAIVAFTSDNDDDVQQAQEEADATVAEIQSELDAVEAELAVATEQQADLESQIAALTEERDALAAGDDELQRQLAEVTSERDNLAAELDEQGEQLDSLTDQVAALQGQLDAVYPIDVTTTLEGVPAANLVGNYTISFDEAYCENMPACGSPPGPIAANISEGPDGLILTVSDMWQGGLFRTEGALYGIADSEQVVAPCGETTRIARVTVTVWADEATVDEEGNRTVEDLEASITVNTLPIDDCPHGLVFYGSTLTRS